MNDKNTSIAADLATWENSWQTLEASIPSRMLEAHLASSLLPRNFDPVFLAGLLPQRRSGMKADAR